ncbi:tail fiber domain-containing protein [Candidatus Peribacteria bacterium]|nr:tail fiber domain-containing protein [Candidatus Peribacteria bacterium]
MPHTDHRPPADVSLTLLQQGAEVRDNDDGSYTAENADGSTVTWDVNSGKYLSNGDGTYSWYNAEGWLIFTRAEDQDWKQAGSPAGNSGYPHTPADYSGSIAHNGAVGVGVLSPLVALHVGTGGTAGGGLLSENGADSPLTVRSDAGTVFAWDPSKRALRAGEVSAAQWNAPNVGSHSFACGKDTTASGSYSLSSGQQCVASGVGAFATGQLSSAAGMRAVAMGASTSAVGSGSLATGWNATAIGTNLTASGASSTAYGNATNAQGNESLTHGYGTYATGAQSVALGNGSTAGGDQSLAHGYQASSSGAQSLAMGNQCTAGGDQAIALGKDTVASGPQALAGGNGTTASGDQSLAQGVNNTASHQQAVALGNGCTASGPQSLAQGQDCTAAGSQAVAMGLRNTVSSDYSVAMGIDQTVTAPNVFALGDVPTTYSQANVLGLGNYRLGVDTSTPSEKIEVAGGNVLASAYLTPSHSVRKRDAEPLSGKQALEKVLQLPVQRYYWEKAYEPDATPRAHYGVMAEDEQAVLPEAVKRSADGTTLAVDYPQLWTLTLRAVQHLAEQLR